MVSMLDALRFEPVATLGVALVVVLGSISVVTALATSLMLRIRSRTRSKSAFDASATGLSREAHVASASSVNTSTILPSIKMRQLLSRASLSGSAARRSRSSSARSRSWKFCSSPPTTTGLASVLPTGGSDILCLAQRILN